MITLKAYANDILQIQTKLKFKIKTTSSAAGRNALSDSAATLTPEVGETIINAWVDYIGQSWTEPAPGKGISNCGKPSARGVLYLVNKHRPSPSLAARKQICTLSLLRAKCQTSGLSNSTINQQGIPPKTYWWAREGFHSWKNTAAKHCREDIQKYSPSIS